MRALIQVDRDMEELEVRGWQGALGGSSDYVTNAHKLSENAESLVYQCRLPLSTNTVNYVADLLLAHLKDSVSLAVPDRRQIALLVLAVPRHDQRRRPRRRETASPQPRFAAGPTR